MIFKKKKLICLFIIQANFAYKISQYKTSYTIYDMKPIEMTIVVILGYGSKIELINRSQTGENDF